MCRYPVSLTLAHRYLGIYETDRSKKVSSIRTLSPAFCVYLIHRFTANPLRMKPTKVLVAADTTDMELDLIGLKMVRE